MTAPYKKRALAGWNHDKEQSNRDERQYEDKDIEDNVAEESKVGTKSLQKLKRSRDEKEIIRLIRQIRWACKVGGGSMEQLHFKILRSPDWYKPSLERYYQEAKKAIVKLKALVNSAEVQPKVRRHIKEAMDLIGEKYDLP